MDFAFSLVGRMAWGYAGSDGVSLMLLQVIFAAPQMGAGDGGAESTVVKRVDGEFVYTKQGWKFSIVVLNCLSYRCSMLEFQRYDVCILDKLQSWEW